MSTTGFNKMCHIQMMKNLLSLKEWVRLIHRDRKGPRYMIKYLKREKQVAVKGCNFIRTYVLTNRCTTLNGT